MQSLECESEGDAVKVQSLLRCHALISAHWAPWGIWALSVCPCVVRDIWCNVLWERSHFFSCLYLKPLYSLKQFSFFFSCLSLLTPTLTLLYLSFYVIRLPLPRLAQFHLTYFFSILTICLIYTNSSVPLAAFSFFFFFTDVSLSDEYHWIFLLLIPICQNAYD